MKRNLLTKTLLIATGLLAGASAWAAVGDVTTQANIDFSNDAVDGVIAGTVNSITIGSNTAKGTNGGGNLIIGNGTSTVTIADADRAGERDAVTISFDIAFGKLSGKEVFFNAKDASGNAIFNVSYNVYNNSFSANTLDVSGDDWYHGYNTVIWNRSATLTIKIDYAAKTIYTTVKNNYGGGTTNHSAALTNTNPVATFNIGSNYNNDGRRCEFDNLLIQTTEGDYTVKTAGYTVKYVCGGVEIKDADTSRTGDVNTAITLFAADKATFDKDGKRYIYVSDDVEGKTIAEDGSTVVTVTFREAEKYGYTITSSYDGNALPFSQSTQYVWEDNNTVSVQCPKYYNVDGTLVVAPLGGNGEPRKSFTITADGFVGDIEYTSTGITNLYLYSEAEDLADTGLTVSDNTGANDRVSGGKLVYGTDATLLSLPAGKYIFTLGAWGGAGNAWNYVVKAGATELINSSCSQNTLKLESSSEFTLTGTTPITITASNSNRTRGIDLIYIQKTGDVELPATAAATLGKNGYTTFASQYDLDLSSLSGFKAYTATLTGTELSFTECKDKVVAGTGLLLYGTADAEVTIPVIATGAEAAAGNALTGVIAATDLQSDASGNYIFVMKKATAASDALTFAPLSTTAAVTVPAGKAYVSVAATAFGSTSRALTVSFGGETTGIGASQNDKGEMTNDKVYNLNGQRVAQPAKGLYIVNGQKVIVK